MELAQKQKILDLVDQKVDLLGNTYADPIERKKLVEDIGLLREMVTIVKDVEGLSDE